MTNNSNLHTAKKQKNDEFYTQLTYVEKEMKYYREFFRGKKILCNCNDDQWSSFFKYFSLNFEFLCLNKLTCISYCKDGHGKKYVFEGDVNGNRKVDQEEIIITELTGDGSYSSDEGIAELIDCDVVVTNPPFSLFRDFVDLLMKYNKKFLIIGNKNAITFKEIFPYIKANKLWLGCSMQTGGRFFLPEDNTEFTSDSYKQLDNGQNTVVICGAHWFTNIEHNKRNQPLDLYKKYTPEEYPKYDNYDAINVDKTADIPIDYDGVMGVPITFLDKYCPEQFEIIKFRKGDDDKDLSVNGKCPYFRILIRRKI